VSDSAWAYATAWTPWWWTINRAIPAHQSISSSSPNLTEGARCELLMLAMAPDCESAPKAGPRDILAEPLSIMGHSMGGNGALTIGLSLTDRYKAIASFAPIVAAAQVPWGGRPSWAISERIASPGASMKRSR
jgi:hypothetical protein